ncbi:MAG: HAD family hydrolase [Campylobacterales bacterium]|nr:HAD family hydrolase [Campylobacterales bacterium]
MSTIFITDLDHTFLRSNQSISPYSQTIWNEKAKEHTLSIATARSYTKSMEFLSCLHLKAPLIVLDGAMVVSPTKKIIDIKYIAKELVETIIAMSYQAQIHPFIIGLQGSHLNEGFYYSDGLNPYQQEVLKNYAKDPRLSYQKRLTAMDMTLKIVYFGSKEELTNLCDTLQKTFGESLEYKLSPENYSDGYFLTLLHPKADKSHALEVVSQYIQRDLADFSVFGDSLNDIGMFKAAGRSIAVQNALDELKAHADIILPHTNDEDGVARFLANYQGE